MRLFAALPLPPAAHARLERLRLRLSAPGDGLRWSTPEQWHITLQFYGEVSTEQPLCLRESLSEAAAEPAFVALDGLGLFANKGILYAAVATEPSLVLLHARVLASSQLCGILPESRPFHPHVTLARSKGRVGARTLERLSQPNLPAFGEAISWQAKEVVLLESELSPHGSHYILHSKVPLGPGAGPPTEDS